VRGRLWTLRRMPRWFAMAFGLAIVWRIDGVQLNTVFHAPLPRLCGRCCGDFSLRTLSLDSWVLCFVLALHPGDCDRRNISVRC